jgi:hypothetical protein
MGISLEEAKQILNVERIDKEAITEVCMYLPRKNVIM